MVFRRNTKLRDRNNAATPHSRPAPTPTLVSQQPNCFHVMAVPNQQSQTRCPKTYMGLLQRVRHSSLYPTGARSSTRAGRRQQRRWKGLERGEACTSDSLLLKPGLPSQSLGCHSFGKLCCLPDKPALREDRHRGDSKHCSAQADPKEDPDHSGRALWWQAPHLYPSAP